MTAQCKQCGKPLVSTHAGSVTSYFFQQNYCQCGKAKPKADSKAATKGKTSRQGSPSSQVCTSCGKSVAKKRAGSFTSFLFQDLRCHCAQPALPKKMQLQRTNAHTRRQAAAQKRGYTAGFKANAIASPKENGKAVSNIQPTNFSPGTIIGGVFKIISVIGEGGMGIVYLAQHISLGRPYALKILSPSFISEQSWLRFKAEAKTLSVLNHPGLVRVYDLGVHENTVPYYSMDYLEGETLEDLLVRNGPQELEYAISIFLAVLDTLAYAHRNNVVHRDIKPANIFICQSHEIKILDFGISKLVGDKHSQRSQELTAVGEIFGSPYYMSPEQCRGEQIDFRSDIYSVGCALFETLTDYVPFESQKSLEIAMLHEEGDIPLLSDVSALPFPPSLDVVIEKCLAKLPQDRYQSAKEMAIDLTRIGEGKNLATYATAAKQNNFESESEQSGFVRDHMVALVTGCLLLVAGIVFGLYSFAFVAPRAYLRNNDLPSKQTKLFDRQQLLSILDDTIAVNNPVGEDNKSVQAYLKTAPPFYSRIVKKNGREFKVFDFPSTFSLGTLHILSAVRINSYDDNARGQKSLPVNAKVSLSAANFVLDNPELLSRFRSNDLSGLVLFDESTNVDTLFASISRLTFLESLTLRYMLIESKNLKHIDCLAKLTSLTLLDCQCSEESISKLSLLSKVSQLYIRCNSSVEMSCYVKAFGKNLYLRTLKLDGPKLTKADIKALASLHSLESLTLNIASFNNDDLKMLSSLTNLKHLEIAPCAVDEKCFDSLCKFKKLEAIALPEVLWSPTFELRLRRQLPHLRQTYSSMGF